MQGDRVMFRFAIHVMTEGNKIIVVGKGYNTLGIVFWNGKETLENIGHTLSKVGIEIVEDQVRVGFRHGRGWRIQIVSKDSVAETEKCGRS